MVRDPVGSGIRTGAWGSLTGFRSLRCADPHQAPTETRGHAGSPPRPPRPTRAVYRRRRLAAAGLVTMVLVGVHSTVVALTRPDPGAGTAQHVAASGRPRERSGSCRRSPRAPSTAGRPPVSR